MEEFVWDSNISNDLGRKMMESLYPLVCVGMGQWDTVAQIKNCIINVTTIALVNLFPSKITGMI